MLHSEQLRKDGSHIGGGSKLSPRSSPADSLALRSQGAPTSGPCPWRFSPNQVLLRSRGEQEAAGTLQAERHALREQTTSLRTERTRLQGELAALRTRLIQVFVLSQERFLEVYRRPARSGEVPLVAREPMLGKEEVDQPASVSTLGLAMVLSSEPAP